MCFLGLDWRATLFLELDGLVRCLWNPMIHIFHKNGKGELHGVCVCSIEVIVLLRRNDL